MRVEVVQAFRARGELMPVGTVLNIRPEDYPRLYLKVVPAGPVSTEIIQAEYIDLLARFWSHVAEGLPMAEIRQLVDRLDALYRELHQAGRKVPIRLPLERNRRDAGHQKEMAL